MTINRKAMVGGYISGLKLIPRVSMTLDADWTDTAPNTARFITLFRAVWGCIPAPGRCILRRHLQGARVKLTESVADSALYRDGERTVHNFGAGTYQDQTITGERLFTFWAPFLAALPDDMAQVLIAHEIAHAYCYASGPAAYPWHHDTEHASSGDDFDRHYIRLWAEEEASDTMGAWGFDDEALTAHIAQCRDRQAR